jgi:hypothetical protein
MEMRESNVVREHREAVAGKAVEQSREKLRRICRRSRE